MGNAFFLKERLLPNIYRCSICRQSRSKFDFRAPCFFNGSMKCLECEKCNQDNFSHLQVYQSDELQTEAVQMALQNSFLVRQQRMPRELLRVVQEFQKPWYGQWDANKKSRTTRVIITNGRGCVAKKVHNSPATIILDKPIPSGWTYYEIIIIRPTLYSSQEGHLNRHFIGFVTDDVTDYENGLAQINPGYWGINESVNGWWFQDGRGSRANGVRSFLRKPGQVTGVLVHKERQTAWFFLDDMRNGPALSGLPEGNLYPACLLRDDKSSAKIMFPRILPKAVQDMIDRF